MSSCQPVARVLLVEGGDAPEYSIDELAQLVGLPSSTIRLYQNRGLIPPPRRQGRAAFYGAGHVARIELIGRMQERGFSLAAIGELVAGWESGRGLDDVLVLEQTIPAWHQEAEVRMSPAELASRFPGAEITPQIMQRVIDLGFVEVDGDMLVIKSVGFLDVGTALVALGFPLDDVIEESAVLRSTTDAIAHRFAALFERHVWRPFAAAGMPADRLGDVTSVVERLGPLAERVVVDALRQSLAESAELLVAREAGQRA
jgi:DNA-binding transcriptional MerR regulator